MLVQSLDATEPAKTLQVQFPFTDRINELTIGVQEAYDRYKELAVLRDPLKTSFTMALSIIWLLSVLSAIWLAFVAARKLVAPINDLVEGTKAVAAGDYEKQLTLSGSDELGFLLRSFNTMTRKIARSRAIADTKPAHGSSAEELPRIGAGATDVGCFNHRFQRLYQEQQCRGLLDIRHREQCLRGAAIWLDVVESSR